LKLYDCLDVAAESNVRPNFKALQKPLAAIAPLEAEKLGMIALETLSEIHPKEG